VTFHDQQQRCRISRSGGNGVYLVPKNLKKGKSDSTEQPRKAVGKKSKVKDTGAAVIRHCFTLL